MTAHTGNRDFLARLDAAIGCQQCEGPLGDSPSDDFCSPHCQAVWSAARAAPLTDYSEPDDQPEHVANLVELHSPETCSACVEGRGHGRSVGPIEAMLRARGVLPRRGVAHLMVHADPAPLRQFAEQVRRDSERFERFRELVSGQIRTAPAGEPPTSYGPNWRDLGHVREGFTFGFDPPSDGDGGSLVALRRRGGVDHIEAIVSPGVAVLPPELVERMETVSREVGEAWISAWNNIAPIIDEAFQGFSTAVNEACRAITPLAEALRVQPPEDPRERALWLRQHRNTGPAASFRAPRTINPRRGR